MFKIALTVLLLVTSAVAVPMLPTRTRSDWAIVPDVEVVDTEIVTFTIALAGQRNVAALERAALAVSDPQSKDYLEFWTPEQIRDLTAAPVDEQERVVGALRAAGIEATSLGDAVQASGAAAAVARFFGVKFAYFQGPRGQRLVRTTDKYTLPAAIAPLVHFITGLSGFPVPHLKTRRGERHGTQGGGPRIGAHDDNVAFVPQTVFNMYNVPLQSPGAATTSQGCYESEAQYYNPADMAKYGQLLNISFPSITPATTVGVNVPSTPGDEGQLDVEMIAGASQSADNWFWYTDSWMYDFGVSFMNTSSVPSVVSMSYAWSELDQCSVGDCHNWDSATYTQRTNVEFSKMALRGISVLSASGDSGANGRDDGDCLLPFLESDYPACSPWVTSVGGTELHNPTPLANPPALCQGLTCAGSGTEVAISYDVASYASGGGFSWYTPRPLWQEEAVSAYLASNSSANPVLPPSGYFNASGRAHPDVASLGFQMAYVMGGNVATVSGTSISTPTFAGLVALLNQQSLAKTGKTLGFVSPLLYQMYAADPTIFQDITVGDNKCTEDGCGLGNCHGYECGKGWDAVTGLGSLNFGKASAYIARLLERKQRK